MAIPTDELGVFEMMQPHQLLYVEIGSGIGALRLRVQFRRGDSPNKNVPVRLLDEDGKQVDYGLGQVEVTTVMALPDGSWVNQPNGGMR